MSADNKPPKIHYIHRVSAAVLERIVGIFVISAIIIIVGMVFLQLQSSHLLDDKINYHAYLINAQGVSTETLINVSGIEVGQVSSINISDDNKIHVQFFVYEDFQRLIRADSTGALNKLSVIGNAVIIITAGSHELPILPNNSIIPIEEPTTVDELMAKITPVIISLNDMVEKTSSIISAVEPEQIKQLIQDLSLTTANLKQISQQIAQGKGMIGKVLYDDKMEQELTTTLQGIGRIVSKSEQLVKQTNNIMQHSESSMQLVDSVLRETELQVKSISQVIQPATELIKSSHKVVTKISPTIDAINHEIQTLPDMVNKMETILDSTNRILENASEVWPLSTVVPKGNKKTLITEQPLDD